MKANLARWSAAAQPSHRTRARYRAWTSDSPGNSRGSSECAVGLGSGREGEVVPAAAFIADMECCRPDHDRASIRQIGKRACDRRCRRVADSSKHRPGHHRACPNSLAANSARASNSRVSIGNKRPSGVGSHEEGRSPPGSTRRRSSVVDQLPAGRRRGGKDGGRSSK